MVVGQAWGEPLMDREMHILEISSITLVLVLLLLVLVLLHRRRLNQISDRLAEGATDNGETLKGVVERENDATRLHVSHAVDAIRHDTEMTKIRITTFVEDQARDNKEFRGQLTVHKTRLQWVIGVVDALGAEVRTASAQIRAWFGPKPPAPPQP